MLSRKDKIRVAVKYESQSQDTDDYATNGFFPKNKIANSATYVSKPVILDPYLFDDEALDNCALFIYSGLLTRADAKKIAKDQRVKIGMYTFLLLIKKIPLQTVTEFTKTLFSKKARDLFSALNSEQWSAFEQKGSAVYYMKYVQTYNLPNVDIDCLETLAIEKFLSIPDEIWMQILEEANHVALEITQFGRSQGTSKKNFRASRASFEELEISSFVKQPESINNKNFQTSRCSFSMFFSCLSSCYGIPPVENVIKTRTIEVKPKDSGTSELQQFSI